MAPVWAGAGGAQGCRRRKDMCMRARARGYVFKSAYASMHCSSSVAWLLIILCAPSCRLCAFGFSPKSEVLNPNP